MSWARNSGFHYVQVGNAASRPASEGAFPEANTSAAPLIQCGPDAAGSGIGPSLAGTESGNATAASSLGCAQQRRNVDHALEERRVGRKLRGSSRNPEPRKTLAGERLKNGPDQALLIEL